MFQRSSTFLTIAANTNHTSSKDRMLEQMTYRMTYIHTLHLQKTGIQIFWKESIKLTLAGKAPTTISNLPPAYSNFWKKKKQARLFLPNTKPRLPYHVLLTVYTVYKKCTEVSFVPYFNYIQIFIPKKRWLCIWAPWIINFHTYMERYSSQWVEVLLSHFTLFCKRKMPQLRGTTLHETW